ncbi:MAG: M3 family metallopeptidase, partial [Bacteroidota bacterium]
MPESFTITDFNSVKAYTDRLLDRPLTDATSLRRWLTDRSELEAVLAEDFGWRYIHMTCETENQEYLKRYQEFIETIQPHLAVVADQLNRKVLDCRYLTELEHEEGYDIMIRSMRKEVEIYREENVPLFTELNTLAQQYARISGAMTVEIDGQEMTLQQASVILQETDRNRREKAWRTITERRLKDSAELDDLFTRMVRLRHQVAVNAGFSNFRDYMFKSLGRFDYTPQDCVEFHESVSSEVVPLLAKLAAVRKDRLGVEALRPWDKAVDEEGRAPLKAFDGGKDLLERSIRVFSRLDPYLGQCLDVMREMGHLDLESRKGKA